MEFYLYVALVASLFFSSLLFILYKSLNESECPANLVKDNSAQINDLKLALSAKVNDLIIVVSTLSRKIDSMQESIKIDSMQESVKKQPTKTTHASLNSIKKTEKKND